jgi:hypothetical protein
VTEVGVGEADTAGTEAWIEVTGAGVGEADTAGTEAWIEVTGAGVGEADTAGTEAWIGVTGPSDASRTNCTGVEAITFSTGRKGEGEALLYASGVGAREERLLRGLSGRGFIHDKRVFRCGGNGVPRLLVPCLLLLLVDDCKEGELYRAGV